MGLLSPFVHNVLLLLLFVVPVSVHLIGALCGASGGAISRQLWSILTRGSGIISQALGKSGNELVENKLLEQRLRDTKYFVVLACIYSTMISIYPVFSLSFGITGFSSMPLEVRYSIGSFVAYLHVSRLLSRILTEANLAVWYYTMLLFCCIAEISFLKTDECFYNRTCAYFYFFRVVLSACVGSASKACLGNLAISIASSVAFMLFPLGQIEVLQFVLVQMLGTMGILGVTVVYGKIQQSTCVHILSFEHLLSLMCDVVVTLDREHQLVRESRHLAALLMLDVRLTPGLELLRYMADEEDRRRFRSLLSRSNVYDSLSEQSNFPEVIHVTLHDSFGLPIRVEIFSVTCFVEFSEKHILGIRVDPEKTPPPEETLPKLLRESGRDAALPTVKASLHGVEGLELDIDEAIEGGASAASLPPAQGTIPSGKWEPIVGLTDGGSSPASSKSSRLEQVSRILQNSPATSNDAKEMMITTSLMQWNFNMRGFRWCCDYHAAVADLRIVVNRIQRRPCATDWEVLKGAQCTRCGVLYDATLRTEQDDECWCDVCGGLIRFSTSSSHDGQSQAQPAPTAAAVCGPLGQASLSPSRKFARHEL